MVVALLVAVVGAAAVAVANLQNLMIIRTLIGNDF